MSSETPLDWHGHKRKSLHEKTLDLIDEDDVCEMASLAETIVSTYSFSSSFRERKTFACSEDSNDAPSRNNYDAEDHLDKKKHNHSLTIDDNNNHQKSWQHQHALHMQKTSNSTIAHVIPNFIMSII